MSCDEWLDLLDMADLFDDRYACASFCPHHTRPEHLKECVHRLADRDATSAFVLAMMPVFDEMATYKHQRMSFVEFLEAVRVR